MSPSFIFSTGIENSNPTIDQGKTRIDEFEKSTEYFHAENPAAIGPAEISNARRFLSGTDPRLDGSLAHPERLPASADRHATQL